MVYDTTIRLEDRTTTTIINTPYPSLGQAQGFDSEYGEIIPLIIVIIIIILFFIFL